MAEVVVENAIKQFGKFTAIDNVSLTVHDREFVVLLGPSGCGKTTLLRAVAGLGMLDSGRILIGGRDVTYLPPKDRNISMVFQNYAIFPHMKVFDNIAFGLKMRKAVKQTITERVQNAAKLLHIEQMLERYPSQMSGGQRQRIAVARAIAVEAEILLMDEPLSNLDALLRLEMRAELKSLLARLGMTTIYVTHDQIEALSMGDRIAIMQSGKILQFDGPTRVYDYPANQFVGSFIGNPPMNFLPGHVERDNGKLIVRIGDFILPLADQDYGQMTAYLGKRILVGVRAENMEAQSVPGTNTLPVTVQVVEPLGSQNLLTVSIDNSLVKVSTHPDFPAQPGSQIWLHLPINKIRWLDYDSGEALQADLEKVPGMTVLDGASSYKPLDFGSEGITGSIDLDGRIIALNSYHPEHGYVTLTAAAPFPETERFNPAAVRAYRAHLATQHGFGFQFAEPITRREVSLLEDAIPHIRLTFKNGGSAEITTFACDGGLFQFFRFEDITLSWAGTISLQRCAYTQLTEGGPLPMPALKLRWNIDNGVLTVENPNLGWAAAIAGLPTATATRWHELETPIDLHLRSGRKIQGDVLLTYGFGPTAESAETNVRRLAKQDVQACLERVLAEWHERWAGIDPNPLLRRGLAYGLMMAVPSAEGICLLTDHMLLPLSWNRDAYYIARALLRWQPEMAEVVRRHLIWMFEQAERPDGAWTRCYLANGKIKDGAFQLDQQLFPLLELADYVLETGDRVTLVRLEPHIQQIIEVVMRRKADQLMLFPTDETPADDPIALPYHLSSHILLWRVFTSLAEIGIAGDWAGMAREVRKAIDAFIAEYYGQKLYAYATDGVGHFHFYHDANDIPLALVPMWGMLPADDPVWRATIEFAFSEANIGGVYDGRLGSIHTRAPWPLGDVQELIIARTLDDPAREYRAREHLRAAAQWDGALPEASDPATKSVVSRHWFAWPNAALACVELNALL